MSLDKLIGYALESVRAEVRKQEEKKSVRLGAFSIERKAGDLIDSSKRRAQQHREREQHYTARLGEAEKELREKGVSVEVWDPSMGTLDFSNVIASGSITSGSITSHGTRFQPKIDQTLLDRVKQAKTKMLDHRNKAEQYEKYARMFSCNPNGLVELSIEDVHYFRLEG